MHKLMVHGRLSALFSQTRLLSDYYQIITNIIFSAVAVIATYISGSRIALVLMWLMFFNILKYRKSSPPLSSLMFFSIPCLFKQIKIFNPNCCIFFIKYQLSENPKQIWLWMEICEKYWWKSSKRRCVQPKTVSWHNAYVKFCLKTNIMQ